MESYLVFGYEATQRAGHPSPLLSLYEQETATNPGRRVSFPFPLSPPCAPHTDVCLVFLQQSFPSRGAAPRGNKRLAELGNVKSRLLNAALDCRGLSHQLQAHKAPHSRRLQASLAVADECVAEMGPLLDLLASDAVRSVRALARAADKQLHGLTESVKASGEQLAAVAVALQAATTDAGRWHHWHSDALVHTALDLMDSDVVVPPWYFAVSVREKKANTAVSSALGAVGRVAFDYTVAPCGGVSGYVPSGSPKPSHNVLEVSVTDRDGEAVSLCEAADVCVSVDGPGSVVDVRITQPGAVRIQFTAAPKHVREVPALLFHFSLFRGPPVASACSLSVSCCCHAALVDCSCVPVTPPPPAARLGRLCHSEVDGLWSPVCLSLPAV